MFMLQLMLEQKRFCFNELLGQCLVCDFVQTAVWGLVHLLSCCNFISIIYYTFILFILFFLLPTIHYTSDGHHAASY